MITLFDTSAKRLGLTSNIEANATDPCVFGFMQQTETLSIPVTPLPSYLNFTYDGLLGWHALSGTVLKIEPATNTFVFLPHGEVHAGDRFAIDPESPFLTLQAEHAKQVGSRIVLDTGNDRGGVVLTHNEWAAWRKEHQKLPSTLSGYFMPGVGTIAKEEVWVKEFSLGKTTLVDLPIAEANDTEERIMNAAGAKLILGMVALKNSILVLDGPNGVAFLAAAPTQIHAINYNRLGAVFLAQDGDHDELIATVVQKSPAYRSGIRAGDVLVAINELDVTKWRTQPDILPLDRFWRMPAGTKYTLTLKRKQKVTTSSVVLQDLFDLE